MRPVVLIANPDGKRAELFAAALARRGHPPAVVVPWLDVLAGRDRLCEAVRGGAIVRLESPGRDFEVEKHLIARGAAEPEDEDHTADAISAADALCLPFDKGRVWYPRQWYRGFRAVLRDLAARLAQMPGVRWTSTPADIIDLFDKRRCQARLAAAGVPIPPGLGPAASYDELRERMREAGRSRVFVKLACGSSASGVAAFAVHGDRVMATTTVELVRQGGRWAMYNSRRVPRYDSAARVAALFDTLCREGVRVEEWVPKAEFRGRGCDLRVLVIAGREQHAVVRLSDTPMTNLHLLNDRADPADLIAEIDDPERWEEAMTACRRTARVFARCLHVGVDLLFTPGFRRHMIVEANAFGDLLPGVTSGGLDTYEAELAALEADEVG